MGSKSGWSCKQPLYMPLPYEASKRVPIHQPFNKLPLMSCRCYVAYRFSIRRRAMVNVYPNMNVHPEEAPHSLANLTQSLQLSMTLPSTNDDQRTVSPTSTSASSSHRTSTLAPRSSLPTITCNTVVAAAPTRAALERVILHSLGLYSVCAGADDAIAAVHACCQAADAGATVVSTCAFIQEVV